MFYYLYQITNIVNNKIYVGVHKTEDMNDGYMGSGKVIKQAIEKYGIDNFRKNILETFEDSKSMYAREKEIVTNDFIMREDVYNLRRGGFGGFDFINSNPELFLTEKRLNSLMSQQEALKHWKIKYNNDENFRKKTQETLEKATEIRKKNNPNGTWYGKKHKNETRKKMSESHVGKHEGNKNSQFNTMWITNGIENKKISKCDNIPYGWIKGRKIKN